MAVPKKKVAQGRSARRFKAHARQVRKNILDHVQLKTCSECGNKKLNHYACPTCGKYRGRQVIDMGKKMEKITKIKA